MPLYGADGQGLARPTMDAIGSMGDGDTMMAISLVWRESSSAHHSFRPMICYSDKVRYTSEVSVSNVSYRNLRTRL